MDNMTPRAQGRPIQAHITALLNPLPRSVRRPGKHDLLDGWWSFEIDANDRGLIENWQLGHVYGDRINLPTAVETRLADSTHSTIDPLICWYERDLTVPGEWLETLGPAGGELLVLAFGACGFETRVWVNGHPLRTTEGEDVHRGEYTQFGCEIPRELLRVDSVSNRLTVRTVDSLDAEIPRGKQESHVFRRGGIWYQTISGPVRSIWLESVPCNRLRSRVEVCTDPREGLAEFSLTTRVRDAGEYALTLRVWERDGEGPADPAAVAEYVVDLEPGHKTHRLPLRIQHARVWDPSDPCLYHLRAELRGPDGRVSVVESNFGMRNIEARGRWVYVNGKKTYLSGILYQPNTSSLAQIASHLEAIKRLGCNLTRIHIAGVDPRIYDLADQMGMLLWVEVPSPHASTERSREHHWAELQRMLPILTGHPSVCILSLYNEDWGIDDVAANPQTREYICRLYMYLKAYYPQLLVVDNDGWKHVSSRGRLQSDLLTAHIYTPTLERWQHKLDLLAAGDMRCLWNDEWQQPMVVGDTYFYGAQAPLLVSEWGGFGWSGYGGPEAREEREHLIRAYKSELCSRDIAGDIYTQATNVEGENNGIIDAATGELQVAEGLLAYIPRDRVD